MISLWHVTRDLSEIRVATDLQDFAVSACQGKDSANTRLAMPLLLVAMPLLLVASKGCKLFWVLTDLICDYTRAQRLLAASNTL